MKQRSNSRPVPPGKNQQQNIFHGRKRPEMPMQKLAGLWRHRADLSSRSPLNHRPPTVPCPKEALCQYGQQC
jgi:hypothetical protein